MVDKFPDGWRLMPLEECMAAIIDYRGVTPKKSAYGVPLVTAKIVKGGRLLDVNEYIPTEDYESWMRRGLPEPGDVVMTTEAPLGEIAQLDNRKVALAQRLITLRGKSELIDNTFLKFLMMSNFVQHQLKARSTGTTVLGIKQSELRKIVLVVPPLSEQRAIANIMGTLDHKIELNHRTNKTLESIARALFTSWFLDNNEEVSSWNKVKLSEVCTTQYGFTTSASDEPIGPKFLRITDINKEPWIEWASVPFCSISTSDYEKYKLSIGDIVVSRMADPGKAGIIETDIDAVFASYLVRLKFKSLAWSYFAFYFLRSKVYLEYANGAMIGSVQAGMNAKVITGVDIPIPPEEKINSFFNYIQPLRQKIVKNIIQSETIYRIREALLPKFLSGEVRVNDAEQFPEAGL